MSKLNDLLESFERDGQGWMYYGDTPPDEAAAELAALRGLLEEARELIAAFQNALNAEDHNRLENTRRWLEKARLTLPPK